jgi:release factor glutamine methyltransferase
MLLRELVAHAVEKFESVQIHSANVDAELIAGHVLQLNRGEVQAAVISGVELDEAQTKLFTELAARRFAREPLQHLTGVAYFRQLELNVGKGVFIPRPETEIVTQIAIDALNASELENPIAVDLGTGSGAIALSIHVEVAKAQVHAIEKSEQAFEFTKRNFAKYPGADLVLGDLSDSFNALNGAVSVVISNPPYIPNAMIPIDPEVHLHEPSLALYGGDDGLDVIRVLSGVAKRLLIAGGMLVIEHADTQSQMVCELLLAEGWRDVRAYQDLNGKDRAVSAIH